MVDAKLLEESLRNSLNPEHLEIQDTSNGCGQSYEVIIVSAAFEGKPLLQRHRLVNDSAKDLISQIHAFSQKTYTPQQWKDMKNSSSA